MSDLTRDQREKICHQVLGKPTVIPDVQLYGAKLLYWWENREATVMPVPAPNFDTFHDLGLIVEAMIERGFEVKMEHYHYTAKSSEWEITFGTMSGVHENACIAAAEAALEAIKPGVGKTLPQPF